MLPRAECRLLEYKYLPGAGFNVMRVDENGVFCDLHFGADDKPAETPELFPAGK